jgi:hypothetical protein
VYHRTRRYSPSTVAARVQAQVPQIIAAKPTRRRIAQGYQVKPSKTVKFQRCGRLGAAWLALSPSTSRIASSRPVNGVSAM